MKTFRLGLKFIPLLLAAIAFRPLSALAGSPYVSDDPEPTEYRNYELYVFSSGASARSGASEAYGVDFNYGASPDLQLAAVLPLGVSPNDGLSGTTAEAPPPLEAVIDQVVVTGERSVVETSIDRKSYSLRNDVQATTGSVADVMRNLPSISVDVDGNPSLRGDANVKILLDGQPAPMLNGANRGAVLEQMGADTVDRIEVMTNPPANFKQDGAAGLINIITKRAGTGKTGTLQGSVGSGGRVNLVGTAGWRVGAVNMHGALAFRHDLRQRITTDDRVVTNADSGAFVASSRQRIVTNNNRLFGSGTFGADVDVSAIDRISAEGSYSYRWDRPVFEERDEALDALNAPISLYNREQRGRDHEISNSALIKYQRKVGKGGDGFTLVANRTEERETQHHRYQNTYLIPAISPTFDSQDSYRDLITSDIRAEYKTALAAKAKLTIGYNLQRDDDDFSNSAGNMATPTSSPALNPQFTNQFTYGQTIHAFYGSYERPVGEWTLLGGIRLEQTDTHTSQTSHGASGTNGYFRAYPNVHAVDQLTDHQTLSFGYGHRVRRPDPEDLNPDPVQQDAFTVRQGNPRLLPEQIDALEIGWAYEKNATAHSATIYLRQSSNGLTTVATQISPTTQLLNKENLGANKSGGLELTSTGKLLASLTYSLSGSVYYTAINAANLGYSGSRSTISYDAKSALNWSVAPADTVQLNLGLIGKRLVPQGYRPSYTTLDLGYRHQLRTNLAITATLSDVFNGRKDGLIISNAGLNDRSIRQQTGRIFMAGLSWTLPGAKSKGGNKFDYEK